MNFNALDDLHPRLAQKLIFQGFENGYECCSAFFHDLTALVLFVTVFQLKTFCAIPVARTKFNG